MVNQYICHRFFQVKLNGRMLMSMRTYFDVMLDLSSLKESLGQFNSINIYVAHTKFSVLCYAQEIGR